MTLEQDELDRRKVNRERVARFRAKRKAGDQAAIAAAQLEAERREIRNKLCYFGEEKPRIDAKTAAAELQIHREFLRALGKQDVQEGETLRDVARRTWYAWLSGPFSGDGIPRYAPGFDRKTQQFDPSEGFTIETELPFNDFWTSPADSTGDEPIDLAELR